MGVVVIEFPNVILLDEMDMRVAEWRLTGLIVRRTHGPLGTRSLTVRVSGDRFPSAVFYDKVAGKWIRDRKYASSLPL